MINHPYRQPWLMTAQKYVGEKEIHGMQNNPAILEWWKEIDMTFSDDETPWCAAFVGGCLVESGYPSTKSAAARSYEKYGVTLPGPAVGAIVVFWRGSPDAGTGHVSFVVGRDEAGHLMCLGGNQGDCVCVEAFDTARVLSYHWPAKADLPDETTIDELPVVPAQNSVTYVSLNEA